MNYDTKLYHAAEHNALNHALLQHFGRALDLTCLKILSKAQARISIPEIEVLLSIQPKLDNYERVIMLYGFYNSCKNFNSNIYRVEMFELCLQLLRESAKKSREEENDYLLLLSVENMISYFKFYDSQHESLDNLNVIMQTIDLYIETTLHGVRDRLLSLFSKIVKNEDFATQIIIPLLMKRPWTDRNKFYFMAGLIDEQKFLTLKGVMENDANLSEELFFKGLCLSLKYRHLLSPGQVLVKALLKQEVPNILEAIAEIFVYASYTEKKNMIDHWSSLWSVHDKDTIFDNIYQKMNVESLIQIAKLEQESFMMMVMLRSVFSTQFIHKGLHEIVDDMMKDKWANLSGNRYIEGHVYEIFIEFAIISSTGRTETLEFLETFIKSRSGVQDAAFRQHIFSKLPQLLLHLAKIGLTNNDVRQFFIFLHDQIFILGVKSDVYQLQVFAVKLLQTILMLFYTPKNDIPNHGKRLHDTQFGEILSKEEIWNIHDETYHNSLVQLSCNSHFDDVRLQTFEILLKYLKNSDMKHILPESIYNLNYPQFYTRLLINVTEDNNKNPDILIEEFKKALDVTESSLQQMKKDPLNAVKNEINLFKPLDCLNEYLIAGDKIKLETLENDGELIELVKCVSDVIIDLINSKEQGLDFSKLDENLELLVTQSQSQSDSIAKDKKLLLHSFWHTLRVSLCVKNLTNYLI